MILHHSLTKPVNQLDSPSFENSLGRNRLQSHAARGMPSLGQDWGKADFKFVLSTYFFLNTSTNRKKKDSRHTVALKLFMSWTLHPQA